MNKITNFVLGYEKLRINKQEVFPDDFELSINLYVSTQGENAKTFNFFSNFLVGLFSYFVDLKRKSQIVFNGIYIFV